MRYVSSEIAVVVRSIHSFKNKEYGNALRLSSDCDIFSAGDGGPGSADTVAVPNSSFDDIVSGNTLTNWVSVSSDGSFVREDSYLGGLGATASGSHVGQLNVSHNSSVYGYQDLSSTFVAGSTYTLNVAIGMRNDKTTDLYSAASADWAISLVDVNTSTALATRSGTIQNNTASTGFLTDQALTYVATSAVAGDSIEVRISGSTVGKSSVVSGGYTYALIGVDNVRLDASAVPEPTSITLVVTGVLGLLAYAWRKRR